MNIGDQYENKKNPERKAVITEVMADDRVRLDLIKVDNGVAIVEDDTVIKTDSLRKSWMLIKSVEAADGDSDDAVAAGLETTEEAHGEDPGDVHEEKPFEPLPTQPLQPQPEKDLIIEAKGKETRIKCHCGQAALFEGEVAGKLFVQKYYEMRVAHRFTCLLASEAQHPIPGVEDVFV